MELFSIERLKDRGVRVADFPPASFRYGEIEDAISKMHHIHPAASKTFKSRVKHFQRIGLVSSSPGRGYKKTYSTIDAAAWALCLEFAEFGITPELIKTIMAFCDEPLLNSFVSKHEDEKLFLLPADFFAQHINTTVRGDDGLSFPVTPSRFIIGDASAVFSRPFSQISLSRTFMINLSDVRRGLAQNLSINWPNN